MTGGQGILAHYDGDDLVLDLDGREPTRIPGARIDDVVFMPDGAFVYERRAAAIWLAHRTSAFHGKQWKIEGLAADEVVAGLDMLDTGVTATVGRKVDCRVVDKRRIVIAGEPHITPSLLMRASDKTIVGQLVRGPHGWIADLRSGARVPVPDEVAVDEFSGGTISDGWLYVRGRGGTFTYKAGMPSRVWAAAAQVTSSRAGPRALQNEGVIVAMDENGADKRLLDAKPRHDLMGRPLSPGEFIEKRSHHLVGDGVSLWVERVRDDACVRTSRLYRVDLATGDVEQLAEKEGSLSTPFVHRDIVHWIESDTRYEMVGLQ